MKRQLLINDLPEKEDEYSHICELLNLSSNQQLLAKDRLFVKRLIQKDIPYELLIEAAMNLGPAPKNGIMFLFFHRLKQANERLQNKEKVATILAEIGSIFGKKKVE